jgi:hypothetical protein
MQKIGFRAVPQLVLLNKVDTQYEWLIQIGYDVKFMLYELFVYSEAELVQTLHW